MLTRRAAAKSLALAAPFLSASAALAAPGPAPGADWQKGSPKDAGFRAEWQAIKQANKRDFAALELDRTGVVVDPLSMFDVQVKRIHEYKRQHLNILHVIGLYLQLKSDPNRELPPRTFIYGGKAAPGYRMAKLIIKLANDVARVVNEDATIGNLLRVVFLPNSDDLTDAIGRIATFLEHYRSRHARQAA